FDPTPALAPAVARSTPASAATTSPTTPSSQTKSSAALNRLKASDRAHAARAANVRAAGGADVPIALGAVAAALLAALVLLALRRRRATPGQDAALGELRSEERRVGTDDR